MAHRVAPGGQVRGKQMGLSRFTQARTGETAQMGLLKAGSMPKTNQRRHRVKRVK